MSWQKAEAVPDNESRVLLLTIKMEAQLAIVTFCTAEELNRLMNLITQLHVLKSSIKYKQARRVVKINENDKEGCPDTKMFHYYSRKKVFFIY